MTHFMYNRGVRYLLFTALTLLFFGRAYAQGGLFLENLSPQEAAAGSEVALQLEGFGFVEVGDLEAVDISGFAVDIIDLNIESDNFMEVLIFIPPEVPLGEQEINFFFQEGGLDAPFFVLEPQFIELFGIVPDTGEIGTDVVLTLEGIGFSQLGELFGVATGGVEVEVLEVQITDSTIDVLIFLHEEVPLDEQEIVFFFENGELLAGFFVTQPEIFQAPLETEPPEIIVDPPPIWPLVFVLFIFIGGGLALLGLGIVVLRALRRPTQPRPQETSLTPADISFSIEQDLGVHEVEDSSNALSTGLEVRLETSLDESDWWVDGEQDIFSE